MTLKRICLCLVAFSVVFPVLLPFANAAEKTAATIIAPSTIRPNLPSKKVIEYGWDQYLEPNPAYIRDHIREMEKRPFNGIIFRLTDGGGEVFNLSAWNPEKLEPQLKILGDIKWDKFTDNFVDVLSNCTMDWFSDADWQKVLAHTQFITRAVKVAGCKGIAFDPESYGGDLDVWAFDKKKVATGRSFDEYAAQARKRGSEFMRVLVAEKPDIRILMFHQYAHFYSLTHSTDPAERARVVQSAKFALLASFTDGMLAAAGGQVQIIDGNERGYYYRNPIEFYESGQAMRSNDKVFAAPDVRDKYSQYIRAGQAIYADYIFNLRPDIFTDNVAIGLSPADRQRWFEQNTYYALKTSDEYVWFYGETMDWWKNENIPPGIEEAIISAKAKIDRGEELGFELTHEVFSAADARRQTLE